MKFDGASLAVSFLTSSVGFVAFYYGKKMRRMPQMMAGLLLMIFPYFAPNIGWMLGGSFAIVAVLWLALRANL